MSQGHISAYLCLFFNRHLYFMSKPMILVELKLMNVVENCKIVFYCLEQEVYPVTFCFAHGWDAVFVWKLN